MKLTREDLAMMLNKMNIHNADYVDVDVHVENTCDGIILDSIAFHAIKIVDKRKFFVTNLLTIKE